MFKLVEMTDTVKIEPWLFNVDLHDAVKLELNRRFANKVVCNLGLCICLFDILEFGDSYFFPGDGASHTKVQFRFVVFRPFLEEVIVGKIKGCSRDGVTVSLEFFDDIMIPPENLQEKSRFDEDEQVWIWEYQTDEGAHDLFMDINEPIRFRVVNDTFIDTTPSNCPSAAEKSETNLVTETPYLIKATVSGPGLGLLSWWNG